MVVSLGPGDTHKKANVGKQDSFFPNPQPPGGSYGQIHEGSNWVGLAPVASI